MLNLCPICNSSNLSIIRPYKSNSSIFRLTKLTKCNSCALTFANPMPSRDIWDKYNSDYFNVAHGGIVTDYNTINFFKGIAAIRMIFIIKYLHLYSVKVNSILEIGPGVGYLAEKWLKFHPGIEYSVVETDKSCHKSLDKLGVKVYKNIDEISQLSNFDLVIHSHVLEHVCSPIDFLKTNTNNLKSGGVLFIDVPCNDWKFKEQDEPHLLFFDKASMFYLLNNKLNHRDIQISYHGKDIENILKTTKINFFRKLSKKLYLNYLVIIISWLFFKDKSYLTLKEFVMIYDYKPHCINRKESWWLRSISIK